ncbi:MAG: hypothetical protein Hyperionvirus5_6 [Hyperionvirus sp.]|uniref:Uncharacterized protein n=1 Tax=Hyperionvirus sp. TaxID=2487770 RepID=A0A3G5A7F5_9VIRU|nr:MAG: hypothetical protein Hyperionvirus5_6 [Hyperionvirus sp.]
MAEPEKCKYPRTAEEEAKCSSAAHPSHFCLGCHLVSIRKKLIECKLENVSIDESPEPDEGYRVRSFKIRFSERFQLTVSVCNNRWLPKMKVGGLFVVARYTNKDIEAKAALEDPIFSEKTGYLISNRGLILKEFNTAEELIPEIRKVKELFDISYGSFKDAPTKLA